MDQCVHVLSYLYKMCIRVCTLYTVYCQSIYSMQLNHIKQTQNNSQWRDRDRGRERDREDKCCKRPYCHKKYQCTLYTWCKASLMKNKYHILATNPNTKKNHLTIRAKNSIAQRTLFVFFFCSLKRQLSKWVKHKTITILIHASLIFDLHLR